MDRFWSKVDKAGPLFKGEPCWLWTAAQNGVGYGRFGKRYAHRFAYELLVGPIPQGLTIDHLCRRPICVNPAHLEPVSQRENLLRGDTITARHARKTHCPQGHPYDIVDAAGGRRCSICYKAAYDRSNARKPTTRAGRAALKPRTSRASRSRA